MEMLTLLFFVLTLIVVSFLVTQTIRRDFKARERAKSAVRRESMHASADTEQHTLHSPSLQHQAHKSPPLKTSQR